jgi:hypothetical protein
MVADVAKGCITSIFGVPSDVNDYQPTRRKIAAV